jgi:plasmid segregation protein ParM
MHFWADFGQDFDTNYFHVTIDGKSYFVGNLAEQQSNVRYFTLDQMKLINDFVKILSLTVAGVYAGGQYAGNEPINVVSGLPVIYYKQHSQRFIETLTGHHEITYHKPDGSKISKELHIDQIKLMPQPLGSVLNYLMDDQGRIVNRELAQQKVGVIDIGFRTTDFTIMDNLRYIDRGSRTLDTGISKGFGIIANKLRERCGTNIELFRLYEAVDTGNIRIRGKEFNFLKIKDQVFSQLAGVIANDIDRLWTEDWDIDTIVLTGGGCRELAKYLMPLIGGMVYPVEKESDPRLNNVEGYVKYGRYLWHKEKPVVPQKTAEE